MITKGERYREIVAVLTRTRFDTGILERLHRLLSRVKDKAIVIAH